MGRKKLSNTQRAIYCLIDDELCKKMDYYLEFSTENRRQFIENAIKFYLNSKKI